MGLLHFTLPTDLSPKAAQALQRSYFMGGAEYVPWPSEARIDGNQLEVRTVIDESGCLCVPWEVANHGRLLLATATLMRREEPYGLLVELARGKVNHLRNQAADWEAGGLVTPVGISERLREVSKRFADVACRCDVPGDADRLAQDAINEALLGIDELVGEYVLQVMKARLARQDRLDTAIAVRVDGVPPDANATTVLKRTFNTIQIPMAWQRVEIAEAQYDWSTCDQLLQWALDNQFGVAAGPLIDFSPSGMPSWLNPSGQDVRRLANYVDDYVEMALQRYRERIPVWQLTGSTNWPNYFGIARDDLFHLSARLFENARQLDGNLSLSLGIAQPWGEYLAGWEQGSFPFVFADTMLRHRVPINSLEIEIVMGSEGRGSFLRDLLETSRLLDFYALLGLPLRITMSCPSAEVPDPHAMQEYPGAPFGERIAWTMEQQHAWAQRYVPLAACKPYVEAVTWCDWHDGQPHRFPHGGVIDPSGTVKPFVLPLQQMRAAYFR